jgi:predicted NAD-dependent protein-ADP-ribosyltransferase YbiA (DUF1768 family)
MSREATFRGRLDFCSNFYWPYPVRLDGDIYDSVEHAYQAAKYLDPGIRILFRSADGIGITPYEAKKLARKLTAPSESWIGHVRFRGFSGFTSTGVL